MQDLTHTSKPSGGEDRGRDKFLYLIDKLRHITTLIQIAPFIYTGLYLVAIALYFFVSDETATTLDNLLYVSPVITIIFLLASRVLRLCKWHRAACLLPLIAHIPVIIDIHIYELTEVATEVNIATFITISLLLLIAAYNVFMR